MRVKQDIQGIQILVPEPWSKTRYEIWIFELTIEAKGNYSNFEMGPQPGIVCRRDKACLEKLAQTFAPTPKSSMVQKGGSSGKIDR
ncbi:hypothetical protein YC2023_102428 [Brassica napus]